MSLSSKANDMAARVETFVREKIVPYESDPRRDHHGAPTDDLVTELRQLARSDGVLTPHIKPDGSHFSQRETAPILIKSGLSPLGMLPATRRRLTRVTCTYLVMSAPLN